MVVTKPFLGCECEQYFPVNFTVSGISTRRFCDIGAILGDASGVDAARPAVPTILALYEADLLLVEDLGAMTTLGLQQYLERWQASCSEIGTSGRLPSRLQLLV
jgi:hypothetical protein